MSTYDRCGQPVYGCDRAGGIGAYCETTPCSCACHGAAPARPPRPPVRRVGWICGADLRANTIEVRIDEDLKDVSISPLARVVVLEADDPLLASSPDLLAALAKPSDTEFPDDPEDEQPGDGDRW